MKVLYITLENLSLHKGSVIHIKEVIDGLRKRGYEVGLMACSFDKFERTNSFYNLQKFSGIKKQPYIFSSIFLLIYLLKILPKYDVIYARDYHTVIIALVPRIIFKKKLIFEINGLANEEQKLKTDSKFNQMLSFLIKTAERVATQYSDKIVSVTPQIISYLIQHFHCNPEKAYVVNNGVNTEKFHPIDDKPFLEDWRRKTGIGKEDIVITFVGNLARWQGIDILIESGFRLLSRGMNLKFLIIGDGPLRKDLMRKVIESGLEENFIFTGMMDYENIPFLINIADIGVAPFISKRNRKTGVSPLKVFEYMACGKPVVTSKIEGLEFVEAEGAGRLTEPGDVKDLEEALFDLLSDIQKRINMGRKGLQITREKFTWDLRVIHIDKLLRELA